MVPEKDIRIERDGYDNVILYWFMFMLLLMPVPNRSWPECPGQNCRIDILGTIIVGFCAILGLATGKDFYFNNALAWALLSFIGTIALAKFLEGRNFDD